MTGNFAYPRNAFLGFDHIFDQLESIHQHSKDTYPPHNVVKHDSMNYEIELAVAGFNQDHIDIDADTGVITWEEAPDYENQPTRRGGYYSWSYTSVVQVSDESLVACQGSSSNFVDNYARQVEIGINDVAE